MTANKQILAVPTNVITGFLGVGKTSAILHLLQQKPSNERWAVLVNEFGEIGVDGSIITGQSSQKQGLFIQEVPGGCMCCASGVPMQVALNKLIKQAQPDRLLIEPTGLGHPKEVIDVLSSQHYQKSLMLQKIVTLVDARNLDDKRYTNHDTFNQQLAIADVIIGNKHDLYSAKNSERLINYTKSLAIKKRQIYFSEHGKLQLNWLDGETQHIEQKNRTHHHHHHHDESETVSAEDMPIPNTGYIEAINQGEGFFSIGWRFSSDKIFNRHKLFTFFKALKVVRIKAVVITEAGSLSINVANDDISEASLTHCLESKIEIICLSLDKSWRQQLLQSLTS
jgi:G3E family GTPase